MGAGPPLEPEAAPPLRFLQGWEFVTKEIGVSSQLATPRSHRVSACPPVFAAPTVPDIFTSSPSVVTSAGCPRFASTHIIPAVFTSLVLGR